jgi:hypothetical protein
MIQELALSRRFMLPSAHFEASASRLTVYGAKYAPRLSSVYASLNRSRLNDSKHLNSVVTEPCKPNSCGLPLANYRLHVSYAQSLAGCGFRLRP